MRGLRLIVEQPSRGRIFVLRSSNRIIGMINLLITISTAEGGFVLLLEDLVVHKDHRGQGYGAKLLNHAIDFAKKKDFISCADLAGDLVGSLRGPRDASTNKKYLEDFGLERRHRSR